MFQFYIHAYNFTFWRFLGISTLGFVLVILIILLKGFALWHAAKRNEKWWFIALLVLNTAGLLDLVYVVFFANVLPKKQSILKKS